MDTVVLVLHMNGNLSIIRKIDLISEKVKKENNRMDVCIKNESFVLS